MRGLQQARDAAERAKTAYERATAAQAALSERLQRLHAANARTAGRLGLRDAYRSQLRTQLDAAGERVQAAARTLRVATAALGDAQQRVEKSLRAREAAEARRDADDKAEMRRRERRDQAASDDRWRPPRRRG